MNFNDYMKNARYNIEDDFELWEGRVYQKQLQENGEWVEVEIGRNKVVLSGLQALCYHLFQKPFKLNMKTFEEYLYTGPNVTDNSADIQEVPGKEPFIQGFNVSYDGSVGTDVVPYDKHKKGYDFANLVPFKSVECGPADDPATAAAVSAKITEQSENYLHYRVKDYWSEDRGAKMRYVEFFTKKCDITYTVTTAEGTEVSVDEPDINLITDKDIRVIASFTIFIAKDELVNWFALNKKGKMEMSGYNAITTMWGKPATLTSNPLFKTMTKTYAFSRCNHAFVPHGVDGEITCVYKIRMI